MARPQQYNREDVLDATIDIFRRQGYSATSVPNLVEATGLQPGSIYAAFGSKKGLLIEALKSYSIQNLADMDTILKAKPSPLEGLFDFLRQISKQCQSSGGAQGCLVMNMFLELSAQDEDINKLLQKLINKTEKRLAKQIDAATNNGEIRSDQNPEALAKFVLTNIWGLRVLGKRSNPEGVDIVSGQVISYLKGCA